MDDERGSGAVLGSSVPRTGEIADEVKKLYRDTPGLVDELLEPANPEAAAKVARIVEELGDCFWYLNQHASDLGVDLEEVARRNLRKLAKRYRGKGGGEDRPPGFSEDVSGESAEIPGFSNCANWAPAGARARARESGGRSARNPGPAGGREVDSDGPPGQRNPGRQAAGSGERRLVARHPLAGLPDPAQRLAPLLRCGEGMGEVVARAGGMTEATIRAVCAAALPGRTLTRWSYAA